VAAAATAHRRGAARGTCAGASCAWHLQEESLYATPFSPARIRFQLENVFSGAALSGRARRLGPCCFSCCRWWRRRSGWSVPPAKSPASSRPSTAPNSCPSRRTRPPAAVTCAKSPHPRTLPRRLGARAREVFHPCLC
jgi:hypothetical protein